MKDGAPRRAIFLDRDGVLIRSNVRDGKPFAVTSVEQVEMLDGVVEACRNLSGLGYLLVMITNQPDVARGKVPLSFIEDTNARLKRALGLDAVETCIHEDTDRCECRKPKPGLITNAARKLSVDLASSVVVGDRWRDIEAGQRAGCRTVFVDWGYSEQLTVQPDHIAASLSDAEVWIRTLV